jgi:hypothetical protein
MPKLEVYLGVEFETNVDNKEVSVAGPSHPHFRSTHYLDYSVFLHLYLIVFHSTFATHLHHTLIHLGTK